MAQRRARGFRDLKVYQLAYRLAMDVFEVTRTFPQEERYSLTDQIRRATRGVCQNIAEAYRKRRYPKHFVSKLSDSDAEVAETQVLLDFARDCGYMSVEKHRELATAYQEVGKMLHSMIERPERFCS